MYYVLKSFLLPPGVLILILVAALFVSRQAVARGLVAVATLLLTMLSLPVVSAALTAPLEPFPALSPSGPFPSEAQAILVLGAGLHSGAPEYGGDTVDGFSLERLRYGAFLHRATGLPLYVSGGYMAGEPPPGVGEQMARVLRDELGVEVAAVESQSRTTRENAIYSKALLERRGISTVLLVTDAWHMPRAMDACARAGLRALAAPTGFVTHRLDDGKGSELADWLPSASAFSLSYYAIHEHFGGIWYAVREWFVSSAAPPASGRAAATSQDSPTSPLRQPLLAGRESPG